MFFNRYWSHIQAFQKHIKRISGIFGARLFQNLKMFDFNASKLFFPNTSRDCSWFCLGVLGSPKIETVGFGARGHVRKSRNQRKEKFRVLPSANRKVMSSIQSEAKQDDAAFKHIISIQFPYTWLNNRTICKRMLVFHVFFRVFHRNLYRGS